jgi:regulatory protein
VLDASERLAHALELAYRYLNRRERSVSEVRKHLIDRGVGPVATEAAIEELTQEGYLDDARFARVLVEDKRTLELWGNERIGRVLLARGIDRELAAVALSTGGAGSDEESERERALRLLRRRFPDPPRDRRERERAIGLLLRKGYESELALEALSDYGGADR